MMKIYRITQTEDHVTGDRHYILWDREKEQGHTFTYNQQGMSTKTDLPNPSQAMAFLTSHLDEGASIKIEW